MSPGARFAEPERRHLLHSPGLGAGVVQRLEQAGITSIAALRRLGVDVFVARMCAAAGTQAWLNRRRALQRAVDTHRAATSGTPPTASAR
jgi:hypothetical protein